MPKPSLAELNKKAAEELARALPGMGYLRARVLPDGSVAATQQLLYTRAICLGLDPWGYVSRFCFSDPDLAEQRFDELLGEDDIPEGFIARRGGRN